MHQFVNGAVAQFFPVRHHAFETVEADLPVPRSLAHCRCPPLASDRVVRNADRENGRAQDAEIIAQGKIVCVFQL